MASVGGLLWRSARVYQMWGSNTDIGKTVFSTLLCEAACHRWPEERVSYLKPVSTGPAEEADDKCRFPSGETRNGDARGMGSPVSHAQSSLIRRFLSRDSARRRQAESQFESHCLYQFDDAVSPHIAAARSGMPVPSDETLVRDVSEFASRRGQTPGWLFVETAGGVNSPGPSGTSQADLYRPLRAPAILIGDSRLGGISATVSAFESLRIRGYDVEAVLLFDNDEYRNHDYLAAYFDKLGILCQTYAPPPERSVDVAEDLQHMHRYYDESRGSAAMGQVLSSLDERRQQRIRRLETMSSDAHTRIWYPFTQHGLLRPEKITPIDSASGDFFQTFDSRDTAAEAAAAPASAAAPSATPAVPAATATASAPETAQSSRSMLRSSFDGSASWWTQGLGHGNPQLSLTAAYAAGRYGHVMFPEAIHEPALRLAELLLTASNNARLSRVFFSDNGTTGVEIGIKMALRAVRLRYGWDPGQELGVIGLSGSYHGDTIGAMDCTEPSAFNEMTEWYSGRGFWFDYPTVKMVNKRWTIQVPERLQSALGPTREFERLADLFDLEVRSAGEDGGRYSRFILETLTDLRAQGRRFGALMLEPVLLGAGGMRLVDPLFQRTLVNVVRQSPHLFSAAATAADAAAADTTAATTSPSTKTAEGTEDWSGLPVIFDEVFTGIYRLGRFTAASFLGVDPDISVHAKLLTGGLIPLATTLASESIFRAFESEDKVDALLHGHSYTANPVGCSVAVESISAMQRLDAHGAWAQFKDKWTDGHQREPAAATSDPIWSVWSPAFLESLSACRDEIDGVCALGSVLAIQVKTNDGRDDARAPAREDSVAGRRAARVSGSEGYRSNAAHGLRDKLFRGAHGRSWNVHARVLGDVLYLMSSQTTAAETINSLEELILESLGI